MTKARSSLMALVGAWLSITSSISAQSASTLFLFDQTLPHADLVDLEADDGFLFQVNNERPKFQSNQILRWQSARPINTASCVALANGSWLSGRISWTSSTSLQLISDWFEPLELKLDDIRAIILKASPSPRETSEFRAAMLAHRGAEDKLWKLRGEPIAGVVKTELKPPRANGSASRVEWSIKPGASDVTIALNEDELAGIVFSPVLRADFEDVPFGFKLTLADSSRLRVRSKSRLNDGRIQFKLDDKITLTSLDSSAELANAVVELKGYRDGVVWLSDQEPARYRLLESTSRIDWPLGRNRDLLGKRLYEAELPIEKALVIHSPAQVAYRWDGRPGKLLASLSLLKDATDGALPPRPGEVQCQVLLGKNNQLTSVYQSNSITADDTPVEAMVDVSGAQLIVLLVDAAGGGTLGDHVLWREPRVVIQP